VRPAAPRARGQAARAGGGVASQAKPPDQIIAGSHNDVFAKLSQGILKPSDATLAERGSGKGLALYDDIERDGNAYAVLQKRKLAVVSFPWEVDSATDDASDVKAADGIREMLDGVDVDGLSLALLDAVLKGFAAAEVEWDPDTWAPLRFHPRDQRRPLFDAACNPRLTTPENRQEGIQLPERKFIIHRFGAKDGNPYGLGLGTRLFWPTLFKRQGLAFWLVYAEKFGGPTVLGKYPAHLDENKQEALLEALTRASQETAIIAPLETEIQLLEAARSGSVDTYDRLLRYMDEEVTKTVLGETLTTSIGDTGSFAAAQTHNGVRMELIKADADLLSATLNSTLLTWLTEFHFPGANPPRIWRRVEVPKDEKAEADKDLVIFQLGFAPDEEFIQKKYGDGWHTRSFAPGGELGMEGQQPGQAQPQGESGVRPAAPDEGEVLDAEVVEGAKSGAPGGAIQDTALNGAQVDSLVGVITMVANGTLPKESASQVIKAAFPRVPDQVIAGMLGPIEAKAPEPAAPAPVEPPKPKAEFSEPRKGKFWGLLPFLGKGKSPGEFPLTAQQPQKISLSQQKGEMDILADKAEAASAEAIDRLLEPVRRLLSEAQSYEEISDGILELYPEMDTAAFASVMKDALVASSLTGAASVSSGAVPARPMKQPQKTRG
jgi:phage gp29-like protein